VGGAQQFGVRLPAVLAKPAERQFARVLAEAGRLSGDQRPVAAVSAGGVDDVVVGLAGRAVPGLGDPAAVQVQPQDRQFGAAGGLAPAARARQPGGGDRSSRHGFGFTYRQVPVEGGAGQVLRLRSRQV
jgi:hypothetical protein